jgi:predicted permease
MKATLLSILFVYVFIALGYLAKRIFNARIDPKTLTLMSVYFMQPFVSVWGFSTATLHLEHLYVVGIYLGIIFILLIPSIFIARILFDDPKKRSIFAIAGFVGNTGNIGIPLGIALFGEQSVIYTTLINLANIFVVYIIGTYIYSRGSFDIKTSLLNIVKIPIIPASLIAMTVNLADITLPSQILEFFKMGAYSGIVLQLFLLGTFLYGIKIREVHPKLFIGTLSQKFIFVPLLSALILSLTTLPPTVQAIILMEMITPLAVANINLASLYDCRPQDVTALILISTLLFVPVLFVFIYILKHFYLT